jgi:hypothetical protein
MSESIPHEALMRAARAAFGPSTQLGAAEALAGGASTRRYVRLHLAGPGAPATAVAMLLGTDRFGTGSDELGGARPDDEPSFVNVARYLARHGVPVPAIYHDAAHSDALILLEDIGDLTLWDVASKTPDRAPELFAAAVDVLVTTQLAGARDPDPTCHAFHRRLDATLARAELEHFVEHGIETRHGRALPAGERRALLAALEPLVVPFETAAPVFSHRDYMAWNLHVQDAGLRVIDFQDALLAPDAFDLAQLLTDRTTGTVIGAPLEATLVRRFCDARRAGGWPVDGDFGARYRLCALQHKLKVIGRFHFLERVKGKPGFLAYLPAVYAATRRLLAVSPELAPVRGQLAAHVPELGEATP